MRKIIKLCDICGKDLTDESGDENFLYIDTRRFDFCEKCVKDVEDIIESLREVPEE